MTEQQSLFGGTLVEQTEARNNLKRIRFSIDKQQLATEPKSQDSLFRRDQRRVVSEGFVLTSPQGPQTFCQIQAIHMVANTEHAIPRNYRRADVGTQMIINCHRLGIYPAIIAKGVEARE